MKTKDEYFRDWESHVFGFGYGSGEEFIIPVIKKFFSLCPADGGYDYRVLEEGLTGPVAWLLINIFCHAGVLNYGSSPRFAWLEPWGRQLKKYVDSKTEAELFAVINGPEEYINCSPNACNCGPLGYDADRVCQNPFWEVKP